MTIERFEDIEGWQFARQLTSRIYALLTNQATRHDFRFSGQITAAAVSIMNNVAEGFGSQSNREFIRFLTYSRRSCSEVQSCLYVALDQHYIQSADFHELYELTGKTRRAIDGFLRYLRILAKPT